MSAPPESRINIKAASATCNLKVIGPPDGNEHSLALHSDDGQFGLIIPRAFGSFLSPGDYVVCAVTLMLNTLEAVPEPLVDLRSPKLIIPGRDEVN